MTVEKGVRVVSCAAVNTTGTDDAATCWPRDSAAPPTCAAFTFQGVAFAVPFALFWFAGKIRPSLVPKLSLVLALGGLQGVVGWYMVSSGLAERIDVSQYRLALHLLIAFAILGCLIWLILGEQPVHAEPRLQTLTPLQRAWAYGLAALVFSQVALGGFVAGLKAGRAYNTWPLMDGRVIPDGFLRLDPWWLNFTENMAAVQFNHRIAAYAIVALALWHAVRLLRTADDERIARSALALAVGVCAQMVLGIFTVLWAVPIGLGIAHQGLAAIVFAIAIWHAHTVARA